MPNVRVIHIKAGPINTLEKEKLLPHREEFTRGMLTFINEHSESYQLIHANFWMSALVAADLKNALRIPFVVTFHALGCVRKIHQGESDKFPSERVDIEKRIVREANQTIAECPQDKEDLINYYERHKKIPSPSSHVDLIPMIFIL